MRRRSKGEPSSGPAVNGEGCCKVEAIIAIDGRGQMVLPKATRDSADIKAGDKLAVISWQVGGKTTCITLIKAEDFAEMTKHLLGPMMRESLRKGERP